MPTGLYTRWEYDSETKRFTARQNKSRSFENMVRHTFNEVDQFQIAKLRVMSQPADRRKLIASV